MALNVVDGEVSVGDASGTRLDQRAFRALYEKTARALHAYIWKSCGSKDLADDIFQDACLRFLSTAPAGLDEPAMRAYLYRTADSVIIDYWRRRKREERWTLQYWFDRKTPGASNLSGELADAFKFLKPQQRSLLWLAYVEGLDHREIAKAAGIKQKSVRVLLFRARKALTAILGRVGFQLEPRA